MDLKERFYPESRFGGFSDRDGTVAFYGRVNSLLQKDSVLLDVGCGRGQYSEDGSTYRKELRIFKNKCKKVIGIDVDPEAEKNPFIDEFHLIKEDRWDAVNDESVDMIICDYTFEHVDNPDFIFDEFRRVLKEGGYLCARTPNLYSYVGVGANLIPNKFHNFFLRKFQSKRKEEDIFPTVYKCNSRRTLRRLLKHHDFNGIVHTYEPEPAYVSFSSVLYRLMMVIGKLTPAAFRSQLFVYAKKMN